MMAWGLVAAALLVETPTADAAGNRLVPLESLPAPASDPDAEPTACTADARWCVSLTFGGDRPELLLLDLDVADWPDLEPRSFAFAPPPDGEAGALEFWPHLVLEADGAVIAGVRRTASAGYSGGGTEVVRLELYRFPAEPGRPAERMLDVPVSGSATIRACFGEADARARAGACADEYELTGTLALDPEARKGRPRFVLTTRARTFPGPRSRSVDSLTGPPLDSADLVWADDLVCTFRRTYAYDAEAGTYVPDRPLPACRDYLEP